MKKKNMTAIDEIGEKILPHWIKLYFDATFKSVCKALNIEPFDYSIAILENISSETESAALIFKPLDNTYTIEFYQECIRLSDQYELKRTICHEIAHMIDVRINYNKDDVSYLIKAKMAKDKQKFFHGKTWQTIFKKMGYSIDCQQPYY